MDSNDLSFSLAAIGAVRQCFDKGQPVVLQPIMNVEVNVPEEYLVCRWDKCGSCRGVTILRVPP